MFKYIIKSLANVDLMAIMPLILFFAVFIGTMIQWLLKSKSTVNQIANLPLEDGTK